MRHNLQQLRALTLEYLDDPAQTAFDTPRLDLLINKAYQDVALEVRRRPFNLSGAATYINVPIVAGTREYRLVSAGLNVAAVSKIVKLKPDGTEIDLGDWTTIEHRDDPDQSALVYLRRDATLGGILLGLTFMPSPLSAVRVYYVSELKRLTGTDEVPDAVPESFHELIALRAALIAAINSGRNDTLQRIAPLWNEGLALLQAIERPGLRTASRSRVL